MKKILASVLALALIFSFTACGKKSDESSQSTSSVSNITEAVQTENESISGKKILIVYFSSVNTSDVDIVSSATPKADGLGSTEYIAQHIQSKVGGDIVKITPVKDYPEGYNDTADAAKAERDRDERPEFVKLSVNPEDYDVIFVGYPMWWYTLPMIMYTFFDTYDFSGKTVIPFNTHAGSGDGGTYEEIKEFEPDATVLDGIAVSGSKAGSSDSEIDAWLAGLKY